MIFHIANAQSYFYFKKSGQMTIKIFLPKSFESQVVWWKSLILKSILFSIRFVRIITLELQAEALGSIFEELIP